MSGFCCHSGRTDGTDCPGDSSVEKDLSAGGQQAHHEKEMFPLCKEGQQPPGPGISMFSLSTA